MKVAIKSAMGTTLLLSAASSIAQVAAIVKADCASCPRIPDQVIIPSDPTLLVAFGLFAVGVLTGAVVAKLVGSRGR